MQLKENRVWIDGCFDFTHHGHSGAILQARRTIPLDQQQGAALICGVHNDADIEFNKGGKPVMQEEERYEHTLSNRWCDEIVRDAPYVTDHRVLDAHGCKYVVHGDDITLDHDGKDCYQEMKDMGRFKVVKRTEGVSTTEIIDRILRDKGQNPHTGEVDSEALKRYSSDKSGYRPWCWVFGRDFDDVVVEGRGQLGNGNQWTVVQESDGFDLFNVGHIQQLRKLKEQGKLVCCSMGTDPARHVYMTLEERCLSVLSCEYVDAVVLKPEPQLTATAHSSTSTSASTDTITITTSLKPEIINRISVNRDHYVKRNIKKGVTYDH